MRGHDERDHELSEIGQRTKNCRTGELLDTSCLPDPDLRFLETHTPAPFPEFPRQVRRILLRQLIQARNLQCFERQSISDSHTLALAQGNDSPHSLIKRRVYFRRPLLQSEE